MLNKDSMGGRVCLISGSGKLRLMIGCNARDVAAVAADGETTAIMSGAALAVTNGGIGQSSEPTIWRYSSLP